MHAHRYEGRFFGRRVNCEQVPLLPAWVVAQVLDDHKAIPHLLVWKSPSDGMVQDAARIGRCNETGAVEIRRWGGASDFVRTLLRPLPRNGGNALFLICPHCQLPRRGLYGWEPGGRFTVSVVRSNWKCRACNKLRYASEGGALELRGRGAVARVVEGTFGRHRSDRPEPWYPDVFTTPEDAAQAGV